MGAPPYELTFAPMQEIIGKMKLTETSTDNRTTQLVSEPLLSIVIPVRNDAPSVNVMVRILHAIVEVPNEVIVVYDDADDTCIPVIEDLRLRFPHLRGVHNDIGRGVLPALRAGIAAACGQYVLIYAADEIGPVLAIKKMLRLMDQGCEFVSATRYAGGGRRYGGSLLGHVLSRTANLIFGLCSATALSDCTSGMKMFRRDVFVNCALIAISNAHDQPPLSPANFSRSSHGTLASASATIDVAPPFQN
jgi:glycosyltransferase involved in cell wall biosynthesis